MATMTEDKEEPTDEPKTSADESAMAPADVDGLAPARQLGIQKYVLAGFFGAGLIVAYLAHRILLALWNAAAANAWLARNAAFLNRVIEDERDTFTLLAGAVIGVLVAVRTYRKDSIRNWINEVATELTKVTWPDKKEVTNSTVVVVLTSAFATVFLALLDRFWGFVTNLVYGT